MDETTTEPTEASRHRWVPMLVGFLAGATSSGMALSAAGASPESLVAGLVATAAGIVGAALGAVWHNRATRARSG